MNNSQLYLAIGVPSILVILAWISNQVTVNRLADKIDRMSENQHKDALMLQGYMIPLHERMAKIEGSR